jgi:hypothetical protein
MHVECERKILRNIPLQGQHVEARLLQETSVTAPKIAEVRSRSSFSFLTFLPISEDCKLCTG